MEENSVYRCYVEKKYGFDVEAKKMLQELRDQLGITRLTGLRLLNRYDIEGVNRQVYLEARNTVLSEPQCDVIYDEEMPETVGSCCILAVEPLPGQFDQRADSCAQCIMLLSGVEKPIVNNAKIYLLFGQLTVDEINRISSYLINPVESRQASMEKPETLIQKYPVPVEVETVHGMIQMEEDQLEKFRTEHGLAMDLEDFKFLQAYFREEEGRDPTITEIRVIDTYWSDHCRHTTFSTYLDSVKIQNEEVASAYQRYLSARREVYGTEAECRPQTLMDMGTIGAKVLKKRGLVPELEESEEINACSIHVAAMVDGKKEDWLLQYKNETHNHPTEIEPFGGAATCIGGCIRDPLAGRAYVYQSMRITGAGDPRVPFRETLEGKLPQRKLVQTAAAGYSSYGNQIGLATGLVHEIYHPDYVAKHLEAGAVVGAVPAGNVIRDRPKPGDVVILLGGRTGRDGIGGATGSSKTHNRASLETMASEVQRGNAPEERKIQRLFRDPEITRMIKRCNDFGAGGVSVAIGELADGIEIDLDAIRKKYDGLDGTELAISESQERMAVVVSRENEEKFIAAADKENLEAYRVAVVTENPRMKMKWRGKTVTDIARSFLVTNGSVKHADVTVPDPSPIPDFRVGKDLRSMASHLKCASQRGLTERFDGSIGAGSVLMPYGGVRQRTPAQVMAAILPVDPASETDSCSVMSWGFDPDWMSADPYTGAYCSVVLSLAKLTAAGGDYTQAYLSFQEYFESLRKDPERWGKPFAALLGALDAQLDFSAASIGGKDSMSGSFLDMDVPPTLISFAVVSALAGEVLSPEFKKPGNPVYLFGHRAKPGDSEDCRAAWEDFTRLCSWEKVSAAWAIEAGGAAEAVMNMSFGNQIGFRADPESDIDWYEFCPGVLVAEMTEEIDNVHAVRIGTTTGEPVITLGGESVSIEELLSLNEGVLEDVYPTDFGQKHTSEEPISCHMRSPLTASEKFSWPRAVIPVFPGTNCEYDTARACFRAKIRPELVVIRNLNPMGLRESAEALAKAIQQSQMMILPGGFSGGDEPDGSAKFIVSFLRNPRLTDAVHDLLKNRDGLMLGICNGFQALIKLGLVPYGEIRLTDDSSPTLTYNLIGRHQSRYVTTRIASVKSPWMLLSQVDDRHTVAISHGEGRFVAQESELRKLMEKGQIATQYVDPISGLPSMEISCNPNGSMACVEGLFSPDGRVFGKMGHSERIGEHVAKNIPGNKLQPIFESGAMYYK